MCVAAALREHSTGSQKNVAGVSILGIGGSWSLVMLGSWVLDLIPSQTQNNNPIPKPETLNPENTPKNPKSLNSKA